MRIMKKFLFALFTLVFTGVLYAQSSRVVTDILNSKSVTFGQVCYLSAVNQGFVNDNASFGECINVLFENDQLPIVVNEMTPVVMVDLAFLYAKIWHVKGGLMYRITNGSPRYAFKQLKSDGVIAKNSDPSDFVSGAEALNILTTCMFTYGGMTLDNISDADTVDTMGGI